MYRGVFMVYIVGKICKINFDFCVEVYFYCVVKNSFLYKIPEKNKKNRKIQKKNIKNKFQKNLHRIKKVIIFADIKVRYYGI
jgi:hypothetical protein